MEVHSSRKKKGKRPLRRVWENISFNDCQHFLILLKADVIFDTQEMISVRKIW